MSDRTAMGRRENIVLVGTNRALGWELQLQLKHFGYLVDTVDSVQGFRSAVDEGAKVVMLDVPDGAGSDLGVDEDARALMAGMSASLIVLSCADDVHARLAAVRMGAAAYLLKPIDHVLLVDTLDEVTGRRYPEPYRVLLIENDVDYAAFCRSAMAEAGVDIHCLFEPLRVLEVMAEFNPELVLMELSLTGVSGQELADVIRQKQAYLSVPIVFLSSETRVGRQIAAMDRADNFLSKSIPPRYLVAAVCSRAKRYRMLRALMVRDSLSGLLNHTNTKERLAIEVRRSLRAGSGLVVAMIDIDRFKHINDSSGHQVGDRVIKGLARLLRERLRLTDVIGRYGGDEFLIGLVDTSVSAAFRVIDGIRDDFSSMGHRADAGDVLVTFSAGLASLEQFPAVGLLIEAADRALYGAKRKGGNQVSVALGPLESGPP